MKPVKENTLDTLEEVALLGAAQIKAYFAYQGDNPAYFQKANIAKGAISAFSRVRASETNRMAVELQAKRQKADG